jgi:predicted nucleic acid-binding protein
LSDLVLIDSSAWTHALRRTGDATVRHRVEELLAADRAAWCEIVRVELWKGAGSEADRNRLRALELKVARLAISQSVWDLACNAADKARAAGKPMPTTDIIIFACAKLGGAEILHVDRHFDMLEQLGIIVPK